MNVWEKVLELLFPRRCPFCGKVTGGALLCEQCRAAATGIRLPVSPGVLEAMRYIVYCEPKKLFSFDVGIDSKIKQDVEEVVVVR